MSKEFCNFDCPYLDPKEDEQTNKKEQHYCKKYKSKLFHFDAHPNIYKLKECTELGISSKTLKMLDSSMKNFKKGIVSEPVDMGKLKEMLDKLPDDKE